MNNQSDKEKLENIKSEGKKDFSKIDQKIEELKKAESSSKSEELDIKTLLHKAEIHVKEVESEVLKYAGKVGYNPFMWLRSNNFYLAKEILKNSTGFDESTIRIILLKVINTKAEPPLAVNLSIPSVKQILKTAPKD